MKKEANNYRPFADYLLWFKSLLQLNCPLIVYTQPDLVDFVKEHRPANYDTKIISRSLSEFRFYQEYQRIKEIQKRLPSKGITWKNLEFKTPEYIIVIYSKMDLLKETIKINPFKSEYFFWIDAGYFRKKLLICLQDGLMKRK